MGSRKANPQKKIAPAGEAVVGGESSRGHSAKNAARHELIVIQQGIAERLQQEIENSVGEISPMLELYYQEYWRELQAFETVSSRADLVEACLDAAIVYCGDYHSLSASQRTATKLIEEIADSGRAVTVAIEMVHSEHQYVLDRYQRGEINEAAFLEGVEYRKRWDFQWAPYRDLLAVCRERGIAVRAINTDPGESSTRILERDFHAAERITALTEASEDRLVFVLDGDLHVASEHLPMVVRSMLHTRGVQREHVIVHQNAEPIYWQLAEQGLEQLIDVVRVAADVYCVFSATPIVKLQSYLNWQHDHAELHHYLDPMWLGDEDDEHSHDYAEQVHEIVRTIADFLHIKHDGLQDLTVFTTRDLDFLDALERDERLTPHAIETVKAHVKAGESYFVPGINVIYLADQSLYAAAEEATHFVNSVLAGFDTAPREPRDAFYYVVMREALGFFGSRLIDHKRSVWTEPDLKEFVNLTFRKRLDPKGRELRDLAKLVLRHLEAERIDMRPRPKGFRRSGPVRWPFFRMPAERQNAITHMLGYILGDKLHTSLLRGTVTKTAIRGLFRDPLAPGYAERLYLELSVHLTDVGRGMPTQTERF